MGNELAVVIMAAGKGTRMKNPDIAKVMYTIAERPMVEHVVDLSRALDATRIIAVVGWKKETVIHHLENTRKPVVCVEQSPQLGTGHAVMQAGPVLADFDGDVLVLSGDVPLLTYATVRRLRDEHQSTGAAATVLTAILDDPTGYGRILRNEAGDVTGIVEHKDATPEEREIREVNTGIYVFDKNHLFDGLVHITPHNAQREYYLTDVFRYLWNQHLLVRAVAAADPTEVRGVNTLEQLEEARAVLAVRAQLTI
jgi:UDP-N-acetylglucosamine pyrophosphorylase